MVTWTKFCYPKLIFELNKMHTKSLSQSCPYINCISLWHNFYWCLNLYLLEFTLASCSWFMSMVSWDKGTSSWWKFFFFFLNQSPKESWNLEDVKQLCCWNVKKARVRKECWSSFSALGPSSTLQSTKKFCLVNLWRRLIGLTHGQFSLKNWIKKDRK